MRNESAVRIKHKKVLSEMAENGGSMRKAIRAAGYSESTANKPSRITSSKSWKKLMEEILPDSLLAQKHLALLEREELVKRQNADGEVELMKTGHIDVQAVAKGLEMAYRMKKRYDDGDAKPEQKITIRFTMPERKV